MGGYMCLVKNPLGDVFKSIKESGKNISLYNNILLPYMAQEAFGVESVKYFLAKFVGDGHKINVKPDAKYLISLDAKNDGEEVIEGWNMVHDSAVEDFGNFFSARTYAMTEYLRLRKVPEHRIQEITDELIRQEIFKKFVRYVDNHNANWAIGVDGRNVRLFPIYDLDLCCEADYASEIETQTDEGQVDLKSFIIQYKDLPWMERYLEEIIENSDMDKIFETSFERTKTAIPDEIKDYYKQFFNKRIKELEEAYNEITSERQEGDEDKCI